MRWLMCYSVLFIVILCCVVHAQHLSPFDVRIDHYKTETTRDLIINTPRPRFSWKLPISNDPTQRNIQQIAYQLQLESIKISETDSSFKWDSERIASTQSIHVPYTGEHDLLPGTNYRFRLRIWTTKSKDPIQWTNWIQFRTAIFNLHEYLTTNANPLWIGSTQINMNELRKEFSVPNTSPVRSAIVYISGIGYYQLYINGYNVDPSRKLDPGWTTFEIRTFLTSFDLTSNITAGMNAVGVKLGNGWYSGEQLGVPSYGPPRLLFILNITFQNGEQMQVLSDQTWTGRQGSILRDSVYNGESYDARNDREGWTRPGFNDSLSAWIMVESLPSPVSDALNGQLVLQDMPPIRAGIDALHFETSVFNQNKEYLKASDLSGIKGASFTDGRGSVLKPISVSQPTVGIHTFDLGQNMVGWCRVKLRGLRGVGVYFRHAEILSQPLHSTGQWTGGIYTENLRGATQFDSYMLRGDPNGEIYEPTFTVHGFRYFQVSGAPNPLSVDDVECPVVHSETTLKGNFSSSNAIINQIQHNIQWGQLGNIMSVPTDCPQRDERRGWMGDAALSVNEALYNFDLIKFYLNFLNLICDVQQSNGAIPDVVPNGGGYPSDPNWGTALPTITWQLYRHYGDSQILSNYYDHVRTYVENIRSGYNNTGLVNLAYQFGDWVPPPPNPMTNQHLIASFAFLHDVSLIINMSQVLGKTSDTQAYSAFYQQLAEEFHRVFFNTTTNYYADGMQAAQVLALALPNVVPETARASVFTRLLSDITDKGNHVSTGIVSTAQLYPLLSDNGHHDLALQLITTTTYPSYGYMFMNPYENATTIWELWDAPSEGPGMNSRNHIMYGSVGSWFYSHLAGIAISPSMITIRPRMASEGKKHLLAKLNCQLSTLYGLIQISYTRDERDTIANSILMHVTVPPNTQARVVFEPLFPNSHCQTLIEGDKVIWSANATTTHVQNFVVQREAMTGIMTVHIGSGQYEFQALWQ
ncbi:unnamed protein product [Adineta steineri]|uniref:alpha-L-rhamnosidase n=1 Tax=Adineta steineri TaxID=433720 RepID=A0A818TR74_9BILA|nr:unnamed protein product [Adineta steineri]CAF3687242.1 unnamed protein product [Adineta steineri]